MKSNLFFLYSSLFDHEKKDALFAFSFWKENPVTKRYTDSTDRRASSLKLDLGTVVIWVTCLCLAGNVYNIHH